MEATAFPLCLTKADYQTITYIEQQLLQISGEII